ncbi:hypothetical protein OMB55_00004230 [gamma proteobacterium HIMB55]|nr:hypothetical protein OMB55_00004230 [gamma proteobacterium HIMB55]
MLMRERFALYRSIGLGQIFVNCIFWLFRKQRPRFLVHFTSVVIKPGNITFSRDVTTLKSLAVSAGCYFQANNGIHLGRRCLFAPGVKIISSNHDIYSADRKSVVADGITIGNDVWIGANSVILPGVNIADRVVIGAGSVVTKSISTPGAVVGGNPARLLH